MKLSLNYSKQWKLINVHVTKARYKQKTPYTNCSHWKVSLGFLSILYTIFFTIQIKFNYKNQNQSWVFFTQLQRIFRHRLLKHKNWMKNEYCRNRHPSTKENPLYGLPGASASPKIAVSSWQKSQSPSLKVNPEVSGGAVPKLINISECQNFFSLGGSRLQNRSVTYISHSSPPSF